MPSLSPVFFSISNLVHNVCIEYIYVCLYLCTLYVYCFAHVALGARVELIKSLNL